MRPVLAFNLFIGLLYATPAPAMWWCLDPCSVEAREDSYNKPISQTPDEYLEEIQAALKTTFSKLSHSSNRLLRKIPLEKITPEFRNIAIYLISSELQLEDSIAAIEMLAKGPILEGPITQSWLTQLIHANQVGLGFTQNGEEEKEDVEFQAFAHKLQPVRNKTPHNITPMHVALLLLLPHLYRDSDDPFSTLLKIAHANLDKPEGFRDQLLFLSSVANNIAWQGGENLRLEAVWKTAGTLEEQTWHELRQNKDELLNWLKENLPHFISEGKIPAYAICSLFRFGISGAGLLKEYHTLFSNASSPMRLRALHDLASHKALEQAIKRSDAVEKYIEFVYSKQKPPLDKYDMLVSLLQFGIDEAKFAALPNALGQLFPVPDAVQVKTKSIIIKSLCYLDLKDWPFFIELARPEQGSFDVQIHNFYKAMLPFITDGLWAPFFLYYNRMQPYLLTWTDKATVAKALSVLRSIEGDENVVKALLYFDPASSKDRDLLPKLFLDFPHQITKRDWAYLGFLVATTFEMNTPENGGKNKHRKAIEHLVNNTYLAQEKAFRDLPLLFKKVLSQRLEDLPEISKLSLKYLGRVAAVTHYKGSWDNSPGPNQTKLRILQQPQRSSFNDFVKSF